MSSNAPAIRRIDRQDVGFAVVGLAAVLGVVLAQLGWIVLVDESGLDALLPDPVFLVVLPTLTVVTPVGFAAVDHYGPRTGTAVALVVLVLAVGLSTATIGLYALCGPGC